MALNNKFRNPSVSNTPLAVAMIGNSDLISWNLINTGAANVFVKFFNAATVGAVSVGTTVPVTTLLVPAGGTVFLSNEGGLQYGFNLGIIVAITANLADTDNTAPATPIYVEFGYRLSQ